MLYYAYRNIIHLIYWSELILHLFRNISKKQWMYYTIIGLSCLASLLFVFNNNTFYERSIAKITDLTITEETEVVDRHANEDILFTQEIRAKVLNGENKGKTMTIMNEHSASGAFDYAYRVGHDVFVLFDDTADQTLTGSITDLKRDKYLVIVTWIFIIILLVVGKWQGLFASVSLGVNIIVLSYALDIYIHTGIHLLWVSALTVIFFTISSLLFVNGFNQKTYAAIVATLLGTFASLLIAYLALALTSENGLRYEEMQFLTRPYETVFLAGLFIGSLGAVMDVAISISSALFELYDKDKTISIQALKQSGRDIGKDIMGTMTNILFFAYISGSIPTLLLYFKNNMQLGYTLSINLSLELARALAGGIGIVITIPIGIYITIYFIKRKRVKA